MLLDSRYRQFHFGGDLGDRPFVDPSQHEYTAALRRHSLDRALDLAELVAGRYRRLGAPVGLMPAGILQTVEGNQRTAPGLIDHHVARDAEEVVAAVGDARPVLGAIGPHQRFGHDIVQIGLGRRGTTETRAQFALMRQDARFEPIDTTRQIDHASSPKTAEASPPHFCCAAQQNIFAGLCPEDYVRLRKGLQI